MLQQFGLFALSKKAIIMWKLIYERLQFEAVSKGEWEGIPPDGLKDSRYIDELISKVLSEKKRRGYSR